MTLVLTSSRTDNASLALEDGGSFPVVPSLLGALPGSGGVAPQPALLSGTILVDPQNASGVASNSSPPVATFAGFTGPIFRTYAGLVSAWGTYQPFFTTPPTIVFVSSHVDNSDPVVLNSTGAAPIIRTSAPVVVSAAIALAGTTAKNRAAGANSPLITNLGATGAANQLVVNATHPSVTWACKSLGANSFRMWQPLVAATPGGTVAPAEVDTWANGDSVSLNTLINVNVVSIRHTPTTGFSGPTLYRVSFFDPLGAGNSTVLLDGTPGTITCMECSFQRTLHALGGFLGVNLTNCLYIASLEIDDCAATLVGGGTTPTSSAVTLNAGLNGLTIDGDFGLSTAGGAPAFVQSGGATFVIAFMFLDAGFTVQTGEVQLGTLFYGGHAIYGTAGNNINLTGQSRLFNASGTFVAALTAPGPVAGINVNGAATASSANNAQPQVLQGGIATTPANLDAAQGAAGFGGLAFKLGGSSIANAA